MSLLILRYLSKNDFSNVTSVKCGELNFINKTFENVLKNGRKRFIRECWRIFEFYYWQVLVKIMIVQGPLGYCCILSYQFRVSEICSESLISVLISPAISHGNQLGWSLRGYFVESSMIPKLNLLEIKVLENTFYFFHVNTSSLNLWPD